MKKLLLSVTLIAGSAQASGTLSVSNSLYNINGNAKNRPMIGLYINEPLVGAFYYESWTGTRWDTWFSTDHSINLNINERWTLGMGAGYDKASDVSNASVKLYTGFRLW
jgi:hypothetical protein